MGKKKRNASKKRRGRERRQAARRGMTVDQHRRHLEELRRGRSRKP